MKTTLVLLTALALAGCATVRSSPDRLAQITEIDARPLIEASDLPNLSFELDLRAVDPSTGKRLDDHPRKQLKALLNQQGVDFPKMLAQRAKLTRDSLNARLAGRPANRTATLHLKVKTYGLIKGWGGTVKPFLTIEASLDIENQPAWAKEYSLGGYDDTLSVPMTAAVQPPNIWRLLSSGVDVLMMQLDTDLAQTLKL